MRLYRTELTMLIERTGVIPCLSDPFGPSEPISPVAPAEPEPETAAPTGHQVSFGDELNTLINLHNSRR